MKDFTGVELAKLYSTATSELVERGLIDTPSYVRNAKNLAKHAAKNAVLLSDLPVLSRIKASLKARR